MKVGFHLQPLVADYPEFPDWEMLEVLSVLLDGNAPTLQTIPEDTTAGTPGAVKVVSGKLTLQSSLGSVIVQSGECLLHDPTSTSSHPFAGLYAGACP